jgi:hypothetical protein
MAFEPPPLRLPDDLRGLLLGRGPDLLERVERFLQTAPRRCTYVSADRVAPHPIQRERLGQLLRRPTATPVLGPLESKFGGLPYYEEAGLSWSDHTFLGQINFAELDDHPPGAPTRGILAIDLDRSAAPPFRRRWYPDPRESAAQRGACPGSVGNWEARLRFRPGWSIPRGEAWYAPLPKGDHETWRAWNDWCPEGYLEDEQTGCHRLFGHRSAGLDEHYGFQPASGRSSAIAEYELVWRIDADHAAGFHWGTNWTYVIVHRDDLAAARLDRAVVTGANY